MNLDDPRWSSLDQAVGLGESLPNVVRRLVAVPDWSPGRWPPNPTGELWGNLTQAIYDSGNVRSSAYAVLPHVLRAAVGRGASDKSSALHLALLILLEPLRGCADIPAICRDDLEAAIVGMAPIADECIAAKDLRIGDRQLAAAARVLAERELLAARIAYGIAGPTGLSLPCDACGADVELSWNGRDWGQGPLRTPPDPVAVSSLAMLGGLGASGDLGEELRNVTALAQVVACPECGARRNVVELAVRDVSVRCPLARLPGWLP